MGCARVEANTAAAANKTNTSRSELPRSIANTTAGDKQAMLASTNAWNEAGRKT